jgi:hypothetical protein
MCALLPGFEAVLVAAWVQLESCIYNAQHVVNY